MRGDRLLLQSYYYPNLSEGADRVCGQLRGDKECSFSGVTKSGRVWRKVPKSDARSVGIRLAPTPQRVASKTTVLLLTSTVNGSEKNPIPSRHCCQRLKKKGGKGDFFLSLCCQYICSGRVQRHSGPDKTFFVFLFFSELRRETERASSVLTSSLIHL